MLADEVTTTTQPLADDNSKVASWDDKRETCANCKHVFLKALSPSDDYCSVDCKSNAIYLEGIQRAIRTMKEAVEVTKEPSVKVSEMDPQVLPKTNMKAQTYSEFDTTKLFGEHVEWAFSALTLYMMLPKALPKALPTRLLKSLNSWKGGKNGGYDRVQMISDTPTAMVPFVCHLADGFEDSNDAQVDEQLSKGLYEVLLHKDVNGLGFCLSVDEKFQLVVTSFRRMHSNDIGPAEASKHIRQGDILRMINGEEVLTLQQVHSVISQLKNETFVLLRFQRGEATTLTGTAPESCESTRALPINVPTQREKQLSHLVEDLSLRNKLLHQQLSQTNVKLHEATARVQTLQEQLHVTRLENGSTSRASRIWSKSVSTSNELDTIMNECRIQIKREIQEEFDAEREKLNAQHQQDIENIQVVNLKKNKMLEEALIYLIGQVDSLMNSKDEIMVQSKIDGIRNIVEAYTTRRSQIDHLIRD
ncbi:hypothetical protein THRCLA_10524, partial [Thraustotheca clavata]